MTKIEVAQQEIDFVSKTRTELKGVKVTGVVHQNRLSCTIYLDNGSNIKAHGLIAAELYKLKN